MPMLKKKAFRSPIEIVGGSVLGGVLAVTFGILAVIVTGEFERQGAYREVVLQLAPILGPFILSVAALIAWMSMLRNVKTESLKYELELEKQGFERSRIYLAECERGFSGFFEKLNPAVPDHMWRAGVPGGPRGLAFESLLDRLEDIERLAEQISNSSLHHIYRRRLSDAEDRFKAVLQIANWRSFADWTYGGEKSLSSDIESWNEHMMDMERRLEDDSTGLREHLARNMPVTGSGVPFSRGLSRQGVSRIRARFPDLHLESLVDYCNFCDRYRNESGRLIENEVAV